MDQGYDDKSASDEIRDGHERISRVHLFAERHNVDRATEDGDFLELMKRTAHETVGISGRPELGRPPAHATYMYPSLNS